MTLLQTLEFKECFVEKLLNARHEEQKELLLGHSNPTTEKDEVFSGFILSLLEHIVSCGCSIKQTVSSLNFILHFVNESCTGNLIDAVRVLHQSLARINFLSSHQITSILEFLNQTYLSHFSLYKYLLTVPRDQDYTHLQKCVFVPDEVATLSSSKPESQWLYEEKVASIKEKYEAMEKEIAETKVVGDNGKLLLDSTQQVDKESLKTLVEEVVKRQCEGIERRLETVLKLSEIQLAREIALIEAKRELNPQKDRAASKTSVSPRSRKSKSPAKGKK